MCAQLTHDLFAIAKSVAFWRQDPRWRISAILDFRGAVMGSLKSPWATSYRSSIDTVALNCLVFEKVAFFHFCDLQTNRQTNRWSDSTDALSRSCCRERRRDKSRSKALHCKLVKIFCLTLIVNQVVHVALFSSSTTCNYQFDGCV